MTFEDFTILQNAYGRRGDSARASATEEGIVPGVSGPGCLAPGILLLGLVGFAAFTVPATRFCRGT